MSVEDSRRYWRSLEELAETPEFQARLHREFPALASEWLDPVSRRSFLKVMSASLALAGVTGCTRQPVERIYPYVKENEKVLSGMAQWFASALPFNGYGLGLLVRSNDGRPTKIEGNPDHPISLGATNVFAQAAILDLYDPDRSQAVRNGGGISSWDAFLSSLTDQLQKQKQGGGFRLLTSTVTSPTQAAQIRRLLERFPDAHWHAWDPINHESEARGLSELFGKSIQAQWNFDRADLIISLESDFLFSHPASLRYARQFADRRRLWKRDEKTMSRLYVAESSPTITGSVADHRARVSTSQVEGVARRLSAALIAQNRDAKRSSGSDEISNWIEAAVADLKSARGRSIVIAGEQQPAAVHAIAHYLNSQLGNIGATVFYTERVEANSPWHAQSIQELASAMHQGKVDVLLVLDANPVFTAPSDLAFAAALQKVKFAAQLSASFDETSALCHWQIPLAHSLESWSDVRAWDGTVSIIQPLIESLYGGRTAHEVLEAFLQLPPRSSFEIIQEHWRQESRWTDFEEGWRKSVHDGLIAGSELKPVDVMVRNDAQERLRKSVPDEPQTGVLELSFRPDPAIWDGRFTNNAWLQELPRPITKLTWDNALLVSPALAAKHNLINGDLITLQVSSGRFSAPILIVPGQADETLTIHLGYGRTQCGHVGKGVGFNSYAARTIASEFWAPIAGLTKTGKQHPFAVTQGHQNVAGRDLIHETTLREHQENRREPVETHGEAPLGTLYHSRKAASPDYAWGMVIDLNSCIGCNACVVACQAENNIPVVGKDQVRRSREMHWIRVDTYFHGASANPTMTHQPLPCMHCENAPCELVCPVEATLHDREGLNLQVYNRCVGTRYCSNNCPYKVRRFNFFQYSDQKTAVHQLLFNPEVTVRTRGIMEKCTYCVQRISVARIAADKENRLIHDREVRTACQQACPTEAIVFGNLRDPQAEVTPLQSHPLNYALLGELNTRPRTTYLAKVRNPHAQTSMTPSPA